LYYATSRYLADRKSYYEQIKIERDTLQSKVAAQLPSDYADEIEAHFEFMPDNYFHASQVPDIVNHLKLFRSFIVQATSGEDPLVPVASWEPFPEHGHTIASFCTWDRPQLLAKIAGS